jgi:hypothetical protein
MQRLLILSFSALIAAFPAQAKTPKWMDGPPGLPGGAKFAVVSGNPAKEGVFTIRAKLPANYVVPPHHHPTDERVAVLPRGQLAYGMGDKVDKDHAGTLANG